MKRFIALGVVCCIGWGAPAALASGGSSIGSAPTIAYGQQEFGNTATDSPFVDFFSNSWWLLPVTAGDKITLDLQSELVNCNGCFSPGPTPDVSEEKIYPVGTNDFNVSSASPVSDHNPSDTGDLQDIITAPSTGTMPLDFTAYVGNPGPYDFTAYVLHAIVLSEDYRPNRRLHRTTFSVAVHDPDGAVIINSGLRMTVRVGNAPRPIAEAFTFSIKWNRNQRGKWQTVHFSVSGPSYQPAATSVRVKAL